MRSAMGYDPENDSHMASDCAIGRNTPPCSRQDGGSRAAWSSTRYSGKSPRLGGSGYERLSSGIRSVRWKESLKWASACTSWNEKWSVSWWTSIMVDSLAKGSRAGAGNTDLLDRNWADVLRVAATMAAGTIRPSQISSSRT